MVVPSSGIAIPSTPMRHVGIDCPCKIGDVRPRRRELPRPRALEQTATDVIVIGSGAVGAANAYALARNKIRVTCIDLDVRGAGVTSSAFGWIGTTHTDSGPELHRDAIADFRALDADLQGVLAVSWAGPLTWLRTPEDTESFVRTQQGLGFPTEAVDAESFTRLEPALGTRPEIAAYAPPRRRCCPRTNATNPAGRRPRPRCSDSGGCRLRNRGRERRPSTGFLRCRRLPRAVRGVGERARRPRLAAQVGTALAVESAPAIRYTFRTSTPLSRRILSGPDFEIRPWRRGTYLGAEDYVASEDPHRPVMRVHQALDAVRVDFGVRNPLQMLDFRVGFRPIPAAGRPCLAPFAARPRSWSRVCIQESPWHLPLLAGHCTTSPVAPSSLRSEPGVPMANHNTALTCSRGLHHLRPTRRLVFVESALGLVLGAVTLPQSYPPAGESPMWAQLLGLSFLLTALCANLYLWQRIVAAGVGLRSHPAAVSAEQQLREFILDERRLRIATIGYAAAICALVPLPPSWRWFWFLFTLLATALTAVLLCRMWCVEVCGLGESRPTTCEQRWWPRR